MHMTRRKYHYVLLLMPIIMLVSCRQQTDREHLYSFYYWRTHLSLDSLELAALERSTGDNLYLRFFDVDKVNGEIEPLGIIKDEYKQPLPKRVVPVIFITNRVWEGISQQEIELLAERIVASAGYIRNKFGFNEVTEVQFDSDWTASTRDAYFAFLTYVADLTGLEITTTLRMHQLKDSKIMGIPPVKKCYLMCYSADAPTDADISFPDMELLKSYMQYLEDYPIRLDIVLPIYSRVLMTDQMGATQVHMGWTRKMLESSESFKKLSEGVFAVAEEGLFSGVYLSEGSLVDVEEIDPSLIKDARKLLESNLKGNFNYVYYHLDSDFLVNDLPLSP